MGQELSLTRPWQDTSNLVKYLEVILLKKKKKNFLKDDNKSFIRAYT